MVDIGRPGVVMCDVLWVRWWAEKGKKRGRKKRPLGLS